MQTEPQHTEQYPLRGTYGDVTGKVSVKSPPIPLTCLFSTPTALAVRVSPPVLGYIPKNLRS